METAPTDASEANVRDEDSQFLRYVKSPVTLIRAALNKREILNRIRTDPLFDSVRAADNAANKKFIDANSWFRPS